MVAVSSPQWKSLPYGLQNSATRSLTGKDRIQSMIHRESVEKQSWKPIKYVEKWAKLRLSKIEDVIMTGTDGFTSVK